MNNNRYTLFIFGGLIVICGVFLMLYKQPVADSIETKIIDQNKVLSGEQSPTLPEVKDNEVLNTDFMMKTKFKDLNNQVPSSFLDKEPKIGKSTSTSIYYKQLIFNEAKTE